MAQTVKNYKLTRCNSGFMLQEEGGSSAGATDVATLATRLMTSIESNVNNAPLDTAYTMTITFGDPDPAPEPPVE